MSGTLRLGVSETIVHTWLPTLMEYLHDSYPALMVEIQVDTTTMLKSQLAARQIDLAFLLGPMEEPRVENLYPVQLPAKLGSQPEAEGRAAAHQLETAGGLARSLPIRPLRIRTARFGS